MARTATTPAPSPGLRRSAGLTGGAGNRRGDGAAAAVRRRQRTPGIELNCGAGPDIRHVGIAFVHGIGSQQPAETLLDWGGAIIRLLLDIRVGHKAAGDPVIDCQLDPGPSESRYIELQLPATSSGGKTIAEEHWVMTEAWWAQRVRPPSFGQMAEWLGPRGAIRRILLAILPRPRGEHDPRLRPWAVQHHLRRDKHGVEEAAQHGHVAGMADEGDSADEEQPSWSSASMEGRRRIVRRAARSGLEQVARVSAALYLQAISALILVVYGALRSIEKLIPVGPLKDGALTRPIDDFVLNWFGDVYVLLGDPAQAASVRGQLVDALSDLHAVRCDSVVVVAHSGGAIVSYMTLADEANRDLRVDRLITLGEGLNLAWLLTAGDDEKPDLDALERYARLYTDVFAGRPDLTWHDFWGSQDPAPVGVVKFPRLDHPAAEDRATLARIESHAIWNRLSFAEDHGSYWENDEEFVLPLLRLLDERGRAAGHFGGDEVDHERSNRRRRRLSILSLWRQLSFVGPTAAVVVAFGLGSAFVQRAGDAVAAAWSAIPGSNVVSGPLTTLRDLDIARAPLGTVLAETGVWVVAVLIGLFAIFALIAPPERPVPWAVGGRPWVSRLLRLLPWILAGPILAAVVYGAIRFVSGATLDAVGVGRLVLTLVGGIGVLAVLVIAVFGSPWATAGPNRSVIRDGLELAFTMLVMILATFVAIAPFVAIVAFVEVGRTVLGTVTVVAAFQIVARIGGWRWNVWDARERGVARTGARRYPGLRRVVAQGSLLFATSVCLFLAVVLDQDVLLAIAAAGAGLAVLLGVSVDVFDASRQERTTPADTLLRFARAMK
jgi:hypothetical protein